MSLIDGETDVDIMLSHNFGVEREELTIYKLAPDLVLAEDLEETSWWDAIPGGKVFGPYGAALVPMDSWCLVDKLVCFASASQIPTEQPAR